MKITFILPVLFVSFLTAAQQPTTDEIDLVVIQFLKVNKSDNLNPNI